MRKKINLVIAALFLMFWFGIVDISAVGHAEDSFYTYEVSPGDSAWQIAHNCTEDNVDLLAESIIEYNNLNSSSFLQPGMLLEIPK